MSFETWARFRGILNFIKIFASTVNNEVSVDLLLESSETYQ